MQAGYLLMEKSALLYPEGTAVENTLGGLFWESPQETAISSKLLWPPVHKSRLLVGR